MEIWQWLELILLWVTVAGYALLALGIFVYAFFHGRKRERSAGWSIANVQTPAIRQLSFANAVGTTDDRHGVGTECASELNTMKAKQ